MNYPLHLVNNIIIPEQMYVYNNLLYICNNNAHARIDGKE